jgi:hypothetical protein
MLQGRARFVKGTLPWKTDDWRNIAVSLISALRWAHERYGLISTTETLSEFLISFGPYQLYHQSAALQ